MHNGSAAAVSPDDSSTDEIIAHLNDGSLFTPAIIAFLQTSDERIKIKTDFLPWFVYCLQHGNRAQRQQLAEHDFLNKSFVAYYKHWSTSKAKIPFSQYRTALPYPQTPNVAKSHTIFTVALRHSPRYFALAGRDEDFVHTLLSLKDHQGKAFVDIDRLFLHEVNSQPDEETQYSLVTYLLELIATISTPAASREYRIQVLRALLLNENPNFGTFSHNPDVVCHLYETVTNTYEQNTFTFSVGCILPDLAHFYGYLFPEAVCHVKDMYFNHEAEHHQAIENKRMALPLQIVNYGPIFTAECFKHAPLYPDILIYMLELDMPAASPSCAALGLTKNQKKNSIELFQASVTNPDRCLRQAAQKCTQLTIQTWRYQCSLDTTLYITWLKLTPLQRFNIFEHISEIMYMTLHNGINKIGDHLTEQFRQKTATYYIQNAQQPNLAALATPLTQQFVPAILACRGNIIVGPSLTGTSCEITKLAQDMLKTWFDHQSQQFHLAKNIGLNYKITRDRTALLQYFLLSCWLNDGDHRTILNNWRFFNLISISKQPPLTWSTLQVFKTRYGY